MVQIPPYMIPPKRRPTSNGATAVPASTVRDVAAHHEASPYRQVTNPARSTPICHTTGESLFKCKDWLDVTCEPNEYEPTMESGMQQCNRCGQYRHYQRERKPRQPNQGHQQ